MSTKIKIKTFLTAFPIIIVLFIGQIYPNTTHSSLVGTTWNAKRNNGIDDIAHKFSIRTIGADTNPSI